VPRISAPVPGIPNSPDCYAKVHPDRVKNFPSSTHIACASPEKNDDEKKFPGWRHELEHDAESVFWLLLYWAMVVQPKNCFKEEINAASWDLLNGNDKSRQLLLFSLSQIILTNHIHSFYEPLLPLLGDLAAILLIDSHWLSPSDPRKDRLYITEAFQRLILEFIKNRGKDFMDHPVDDTFRKVNGMQDSAASPSTPIRTLDTSRRATMSVGCVCESVNFCPFLLLCLQSNVDIAMGDIQ
jgi:hypothetical protein